MQVHITLYKLVVFMRHLLTHDSVGCDMFYARLMFYDCLDGLLSNLLLLSMACSCIED